MAAPLVASLSVTDRRCAYVPAAGLNAGVATRMVKVALVTGLFAYPGAAPGERAGGDDILVREGEAPAEPRESGSAGASPSRTRTRHR